MENITDSLIGEWRWIDTSVLYENEWQILEIFIPFTRVWNFEINGMMEIEYAGGISYRASYKLNKSSNILSLNGHKLDGDGEKYAVVYEKYRVYFLNPDEFYLYDLEGKIGFEVGDLRLHFMRKS